MNDKIRTGIAQATRLTRAGKLAEATAMIQRTLQGRFVPEASSDSTDRPREQAIDVVATEILEINSLSAPKTAYQKEAQTSSLERALLSPPESQVASEPNQRASAKLSAPQASTAQGRQTKAATTRQDTPRSKPLDFIPPVLKRPTKLNNLFQGKRRDSVAIPWTNPTAREVCPGGQFVEGAYTNQAGTRSYKLYIPSGYSGQSLPLVVMLHGCTQTPDDFAAGSRMNVLAERELFFVVYPTQAVSANSSKCWNWFKATDQQREQGEPSLIAGITHQVVSTYSVEPKRIYVAGLSAGAAMAVILGVSYPDIYAAIGVHSGLAYGTAYDLPSAFAAMRQPGAMPAQPTDISFLTNRTANGFLPLILFHGERDLTVHSGNSDQVLAQWVKLNSPPGTELKVGSDLRVAVTHNQIPDGHSYTRSIYHKAADGSVVMEQWLVHGAGHAWSGGSPNGSFTDAKGPNASQEMVRFFCEHPMAT